MKRAPPQPLGSGFPPGLRLLPPDMGLLLRAIRLLFECLPEAWAQRAGAGIGLLALQLGIRRRVVREQMARALELEHRPRELARLVRANYRHYGISLAEFLRLRLLVRRGLTRRIRWRHPERLLRTRPRGTVLLLAHLGNYPLGGAATAALGAPISYVIKRIRNPAVHDFWIEQLSGSSIRFIFNRDSMREILGVLRRGELLGFMFDQHDSRGGIWVDFLGRPACCFRALPILAARAGAVVPVFPYRDRDGRHVIEVGDPIPWQDQGDEDANVAYWAQHYSDLIADAVRRHPEQWLWMHRRWKRMPPDAPMTPRCAALLRA